MAVPANVLNRLPLPCLCVTWREQRGDAAEPTHPAPSGELMAAPAFHEPIQV